MERLPVGAPAGWSADGESADGESAGGESHVTGGYAEGGEGVGEGGVDEPLHVRPGGLRGEERLVYAGRELIGRHGVLPLSGHGIFSVRGFVLIFL